MSEVEIKDARLQHAHRQIKYWQQAFQYCFAGASALGFVVGSVVTAAVFYAVNNLVDLTIVIGGQ